MTLNSGTYEFGPDKGELLVKTGRAGAAAKAGHDLTIAVTEWSGTLEVGEDSSQTRVELTADGGSLEVRDGQGGVTTLTDPDKRGIEDTIDEEVLKKSEITFRSTSAEHADANGLIRVQGELELAGQRAPVNFELTIEDDSEDENADEGDGDESGEDDAPEDDGEAPKDEGDASEDDGQAPKDEGEASEDDGNDSDDEDSPQDEADDESTDDEDKPWAAKKNTCRITGSALVKQSDFGIKQYSTLFGTLKVADEVEITFSGKVSQSR